MNSSKFSSTNASQTGSYASINYLLFGFRVARSWKTSFGLVPYSDVGYNTVVDGIINNIPFNDIYSGNGGINKAFWTHSFNITKNFSIGIESGFLFGEIERSYIRVLYDTEFAYHIKESNTDTFKKFYLKYGIQYTHQVKEDLKLVIGAIASTKTSVDTDRKRIVETQYIAIKTI